MKPSIPLMSRTVTWLKNLVAFSISTDGEPKPTAVRNDSLPQLYEAQHTIILGMFRLGVAGFCALFIVLISFTLFSYVDPHTPDWVVYTMVAVAALLLLGFYRTLQEFRTYLESYAAISTLLRETARPAGTTGKPRPRESKVLSVLKPKEHKGWDAKVCDNCHKAIELLATVCHHCGHEHEDLLAN